MSLEVLETSADQVVLPIGVEVPWGEWRQGNESDILYTSDAEECIAIAVFDPIKRLGYMAHILAREQSQDEILLPFTTAILKNCEGDAERLSICLAGGRLDEDSITHYGAALNRRNRVVKTFEKIGIPDPWHIEWDEEFIPQNLELDCSTGDYRLTRVKRAPFRSTAGYTQPQLEKETHNNV